MAQFETEVRAERVRAGQEAARAAGKTWGGSRAGRREKSTREKIDVVKRLLEQDKPIAYIARTLGMSRTTVYSIRDEPDAA